MSEWAAKRFWQDSAIVSVSDGVAVELDGRGLRTPAGAPLHLPTRALAEAIAAEWDAQVDQIDPSTMPLTRTANSAIDKVAPQRGAVVQALAEYGRTDLLCYRAPTPEALIARQSASWDPLLDWADTVFGARLRHTTGVMPIAQAPEAIERLAAPMAQMSVFQLAAFHDLVGLTGSLVLGLAATSGDHDPAVLWETSQLDELFQIELWGHDDEAAARGEINRAAFLDAAKFYRRATSDK